MHRSKTYLNGATVIGGIFSLLLFSALFLASCVDQPVDPIKDVKVDTMVRVERDTVRITDTTEVIVYRTKKDTIYDTIYSRVYDTVFVRSGSPKIHKAELRYDVDRAPMSKVELDVAPWISYQVVEYAGKPAILSISLSYAIPFDVRDYDIVDKDNVGYPAEMHLTGVNFFLPETRIDGSGGYPEILLLQHPYFEVPNGQNVRGGLMLTVRPQNTFDLINYWTGQVAIGNRQETRNRGSIKIRSVDNRTITAEIDASFYFPVPSSGNDRYAPFDLRLNLELEY